MSRRRLGKLRITRSSKGALVWQAERVVESARELHIARILRRTNRRKAQP